MRGPRLTPPLNRLHTHKGDLVPISTLDDLHLRDHQVRQVLVELDDLFILFPISRDFFRRGGACYRARQGCGSGSSFCLSQGFLGDLDFGFEILLERGDWQR